MSQPAEFTGAAATAVEVVRSDRAAGPFRAALFDFDGTLSLLRRNWQDVMIPMFVDVLAANGAPESRAELVALVEEFVMRLNGRQTIYQMMRLAEEVRARGGVPLEPLAYKRQYHDLLMERVAGRLDAVRSGAASAEEMTVPGVEALLRRLCDAGWTLYLASGTDLAYVRDELALLGLDGYFGPRVYGALDEYQKFSKAQIVARILAETGLAGRQIVGFGDGFVEIEEVRKVGGLAIGVASNEDTRQGVNDWKRRRLIQAGADVIVGDYRELNSLLALLGL